MFNCLLSFAVVAVVESKTPWQGEAGAFWLAPKQSHNIHINFQVRPVVHLICFSYSSIRELQKGTANWGNST